MSPRAVVYRDAKIGRIVTKYLPPGWCLCGPGGETADGMALRDADAEIYWLALGALLGKHRFAHAMPRPSLN